MTSAAITRVVEGKKQGCFSFECSKCGYCGGNYPTRQDAQMYATLHQDMDVPEHR
jgi:hypothetical protein